jgi:exopolyphosphatase/guanosine-5'-triphosphate,3'-diphosphate pyrophosphatase
MKTLAAIDIGTNSIRLEAVRVEEDHSLTTLTQQKQTVRLGEGEFANGQMTAAAIERGALVCARFADVARGFGAEEIVAVATSAVREAENRDEFIERVQEEADLEVRVISGPEEARLIYLGVSSGADLGDKRALFIDIGGGSTELILGDANNYFMLDSLKLGSIRLANKFLVGEKGPISLDRFTKMVDYARAVAGHTTRRFTGYGFDSIYGSAGTITNLADATARRLGDAPSSLRNYQVKVSDLRTTVEMLCKLNLEERRRVPGLDPDRADIILGGAAVLMAVLEDSRAEKITISDRGLRHGILIDRLMREDEARATYENISVRERSILQLARTCNFDEEHANHVAALSLSMFDDLRRLGYHPYGARERELLKYGAFVHDIGCFLSHSNHQRHAYYLVRHSDLLGFNDSEIAVIANIAYYHRKSIPKKRHENLQSLSRQGRKMVSVLAAILRIAEGLDRSHLALVQGVEIQTARNPERLVLTLFSESDCQLELWGVETNYDLFQDVFGVPLSIKVASPSKSRELSSAAT